MSIMLGTGLVALMYRYLPARRLAWRHVLTGALVTALLFHLGRWAIGLYLGRATQPTAYGAAASFAALLLWLYYSAQIFLFGAEFTACLGQSRKPSRWRALRRRRDYLRLMVNLPKATPRSQPRPVPRSASETSPLVTTCALGGFHRAGMRFGAGIAAEDFVDVLHVRRIRPCRPRWWTCRR